MIVLSEYEQQFLENQESYYWKVKAKAFQELYRVKCEEMRSVLNNPTKIGISSDLTYMIFKGLRASMRRQGD